MKINSDFRDLLFEFNAAEVRYLVVGAYAVFFHAQPRYTKDLDLWVDPTQANAPPNRIDVLTEISAVFFEEAWAGRIEGKYGDQRAWILGREQLLKNKRAVGRAQDLLDVEKLERSKTS